MRPLPSQGPTAASPQPDAPIGRPLWHDALWSLVGEGLYAAGLFATLVLLARLGSVEALGQYTLGLAIATPAILLTNLHLRPAYVVDRGRWRYDQVLGLRLLTIPVALAVTLGVALAAGYDRTTVLMVAAVGGLRAWESLSDILLAPAQKAQRMAAIGRSRALRGLLTAGGLGVGLALTGDPLIGMALALVLLGGLGLVYDRAIARRFTALRPAAPSRDLLALARHTLPIGLAATLLAVGTNVPAFVLEHTHDVTALGYFGAVMSVLYVGNVLNVALGNAAIPRLARCHQHDRPRLGRLLARLLVVVLALDGLLVLGAVVLGEPYLREVYGPAYAAHAGDLRLMALTAAVAGLANMLSQTVTAMGRFGQQLAINAGAALGGVLLALGLVPGGGVRGAISALLAYSALRLVIYALAMRRALARS